MRPVPSVCVLALLALLGCGPKNASEAENKRDVSWLTDHPTGDAVAALGRLADTDPKALEALKARAPSDVNVYIAAWTAVTRGAGWGTEVLKAGLADPARAELASSAMPRKDARLGAFVADLDAAVVRLAAGRNGSVLAGLIASVGPTAHAAIQARLVDPRTRNAMCEGIALPEASADAKATLLAVPAEARDAPSCLVAVMEMAAKEDSAVTWIATEAEPGILNAAATSTLPCPRVALVWRQALAERAPNAAMTVPLQRSITRCATAMDPVLAELLAKAPRSRPVVVSALDPFGTELASLRQTCAALDRGYAKAESPVVRERARDALAHGCAFAR